jgi:carboxymethylenebutenolidase
MKQVPHVPKSDLGAMFDLHVKCEFQDHDVEATMRTMVDDPYVHNVPVLKGGYGREGVYDFYKRHFVGKMPADTRVEPISRTVGPDCVIDELIVCFTHDIVIDYLLPGIKPTGRYVELPHVVVMKFHNGKVAHEHIYWDQACLLAQVGLLDARKLPVTGKEQAAALRNLTQKKKRQRVG